MNDEPLQLYNDYKDAVADWGGTRALPEHVEKTIDESRVVIDPYGNPVGVFVKGWIDPKLLAKPYHDWRQVKGLPELRSNAACAPSFPRINKDKKPGKFPVVPKPVMAELEKRGVGTGTIGYVKGHRTPLTKKHRGWLKNHMALVRRINARYRRSAPSRYKDQRPAAKRIRRHIPSTAFTAIYLSKNWQTCYHVDGNLPGAFTCLIAMGTFTGGDLVLPRYRISFALRPGDILFFDAEELHGNLPIKGERLSAAFYCEKPL